MLNGLKDVRVSWVSDSHHTNSVQLTASSSQFNIVAIEVMDVGSGEHTVVFELSLSERWAVVSNDNKLSLSLTEQLQGLSVS